MRRFIIIAVLIGTILIGSRFVPHNVNFGNFGPQTKSLMPKP